VRFSAAARITTFPTLTLPVKKMKSNGSLSNSVFSLMVAKIQSLPITAETAPGSKYFGTSSKISYDVLGS
jgi:hypothetical protein